MNLKDVQTTLTRLGVSVSQVLLCLMVIYTALAFTLIYLILGGLWA